MKNDDAYLTEILQFLPHRKPFLFADKVEVVEGRIIGERRFPPDEFFFGGHFPGYPVVPGVILLESMFQCGGVGVRKMGIKGNGTFFLGEVKEARFRRQVRPDELYRVEIENVKATPNIVHQRGKGYVGDELAVEAEWLSIAGGGGGMILKPMVRNNICINAHPLGCAVETRRQIDFTLERASSYKRLRGPEAVLVIGCSTGYGLASRIAATFGFGSKTVGVSFEKEPSETKTGTPGWYNNRAFDDAALRAGIASRSLDGDAFSKDMKARVAAAARELGLKFDLVVYSLASPVRGDPETGKLYRSVIKPIGGVYRGRNVDVFTGALSHAEIQPADEVEIAETVKVMGGEDWELWIDALRDAGLLAKGATTMAYSYVGPQLSWPIYRDGTIGKAKAHLEASAKRLTASGAASDGLRAYVSINKALVTRASAVIPVIPLYVSTLFKVMKERGIHEDCIAQIDRLYRERLYSGGKVPLDEEGRLRVDELEMGAAVQAEVEARMARITGDNLGELADVEGFRLDFLRVHGFAVEGIDYEAEVSPLEIGRFEAVS